MESQINLETIGNLQINPLAELLVEIIQNNLNGTLRVTSETQKVAVYFDAGEVVFAASNARRHRLFEMLLHDEKITRDQLAVVPDFTNDLAFKEHLFKNELFEKKEIDAFFSRQMSEILKDALAWRQGDWTFNPLVRIKGNIRFSVDLWNLLAEYARDLPLNETARKFANPEESFRVKSKMPANINLSPPESFVLSRFENAALTINKIQNLSGLPEADTRRILNALWLGGLLVREDWSAAFSERKIAAISEARISLKKEEDKTPTPVIQPPVIKGETSSSFEEKVKAVEEKEPVEKQISLDEYLNRVEKAANFYEIFRLAPGASISEIKKIYFSLAKRFHPDLYYRETDAAHLQQIQAAFSKLAHAYDTLKTECLREVYDFKMRKELAEMKSVQQSEATYEAIDLKKQNDQAEENFQRGFSLLMDGNHETAVPLLARAVHFAQNNARYHAYYGKALAADNKQRHKAESELQTAISLENGNADYRIMMAEFFVQFNLLKRAEGELNRLLAVFPNNREAKRLLDSLPKK